MNRLLALLYVAAARLPGQRGRTWLQRSFRHRFAGRNIVASTWGGRMKLDFDDYVDHEIILHGYFEPLSTRWLEKRLVQGSTFLDIGAHHGFHTLVAARACGPEGRAVAIEPWPKNFRRLRENIRLNRMEDRIQCLEYALGTSDADVSFAAPDLENSGTGRVTTSLLNGLCTVSQTTARSVIKQFEFQQIDAAKIDVEGAELDVLAGWPLETLPRYMLLELLPEGDRNDQVLEWLNQHHYRVETVTGALFKKGGHLPETNLAATRQT